jgi:hypothetical protein
MCGFNFVVLLAREFSEKRLAPKMFYVQPRSRKIGSKIGIGTLRVCKNLL